MKKIKVILFAAALFALGCNTQFIFSKKPGSGFGRKEF